MAVIRSAHYTEMSSTWPQPSTLGARKHNREGLRCRYTTNSSEASGSDTDSDDEILAAPVMVSKAGSSKVQSSTCNVQEEVDVLRVSNSINTASQEEEQEIFTDDGKPELGQPSHPNPRVGGRMQTAPAWQHSGEHVLHKQQNDGPSCRRNSCEKKSRLQRVLASII